MKRLLTLFLVLFVSNQLLADEWFQRADITNFGRHRCAGFAIGNKAYAGIGHMNGTGVNIVYQDWWEFDPASNSWTQKANYPSAKLWCGSFWNINTWIHWRWYLSNKLNSMNTIL